MLDFLILLLFPGSGGGPVPPPPYTNLAEWSTGCGTIATTDWKIGIFARKVNGFILFTDVDGGQGFAEDDSGFLVFTGTAGDRLEITKSET